MTPHPSLAPVRPLVHAVARAVAPDAASFDDARWARADAAIDRALADRPGSVVRQVVLFLRVLDLLARARYGRGFARLAPERALRLLGVLERAPLLLLRRGVWGVRTLAFMGCYAPDEGHAALGYHAAPGGWSARASTAGTWPARKGLGAPEPGTLVARDRDADA